MPVHTLQLRPDIREPANLRLPEFNQPLDADHSYGPHQPGNAIMQEDGMDLWKSAVKYASGPSPELMDLAPLAVASLAGGSDGIKDVLHLVEAYTLLDPHNFVPVSSQPAGLRPARLT